MSRRLNADASVTAVACANQVSRRFGDARVVLENILRLDSDDSVPGMPSRYGRTILFTDDFWNVQHICTTAVSNGRVSAATAYRSGGQWFEGDGHGGGACHQTSARAPCSAAPRPRRRTRRTAVSIAVTALRTDIDPNVAADANLARHTPVAVCIRFAARSGRRGR